jgi:uncharacterized protein YdbL (DUF1318 family)
MSNRSRFFNLLTALCLAIGLLMSAGDASAQSRLLDAPRAAGMVGERDDGFAVVRGTVPPEITVLVNQVNSERRALYAERAKKDGVPAEAIGKIYAAEIMKAAPAGTWFLDSSGKWTQR